MLRRTSYSAHLAVYRRTVPKSCKSADIRDRAHNARIVPRHPRKPVPYRLVESVKRNVDGAVVRQETVHGANTPGAAGNRDAGERAAKVSARPRRIPPDVAANKRYGSPKGN